MEIIGHLFASHDADGGGEFGVEGGHPVERVHCELRWRVKVRDLAERVDSGIGAAGALQLDGFFGDLLERPQNEILHGIAAGLRLPSIERSAVVSDCNFEVHSDFGFWHRRVFLDIPTLNAENWIPVPVSLHWGESQPQMDVDGKDDCCGF